MNIHQFVVSASFHGSRIDVFLDRQGVSNSRSHIKKCIASGGVCVDGQQVYKPAQKLKNGQRVALSLLPPEPLNAVPEDIPLSVVFEDAHLLVIDKPQGMVVHPAPGHFSGTLVNALVYRYSFLAGDPLRPGLVHRLDKDTSGVMVVAKTEYSLGHLVKQFQVHSVERRYEVLVAGQPPNFVRLETLHGRRPNERKLFSSRVSKGKVAISEVEVVERFPGAAWCRVTLHTGRTHQVRVHCFDNGFPVLGDPLYVPRRLTDRLRAIHQQLPGQALHAGVLAIDHPDTGKRLRFEVAPPDSFLSAVTQLKQL